MNTLSYTGSPHLTMVALSLSSMVVNVMSCDRTDLTMAAVAVPVAVVRQSQEVVAFHSHIITISNVLSLTLCEEASNEGCKW